jgi:hypothetical protein
VFPITIAAAVADNPPVTTLNTPADGFFNDTSSTDNVSFNCSATDDNALVNITLWITNSSNTSFSQNQTANITGTANSTIWTLNLTEGDYTWNCISYDNASQSDWAVNRTIKMNLTDVTDPIITIITPDNNSNITSANFGEEINVSTNEAVNNCTLNDTKWTQVFGNTTFVSWNNNTAILEGTHSINISCWDASSNNGSTYLFFSIDDTAPTMEIPANVSLEHFNDSLAADFNATDTNGISTWFVNDTGNFSIDSGGNLTNATNLARGIHHVLVSVNDTAGNVNSSVYQVTVVDNTPPIVTIESPVNNSKSGIAVITYNITTDEPANSCQYSVDEGTHQDLLQITSTFWQGADALADGKHNLSANCTDTSGNEGNSTLTIFFVDTSPATVTINYPLTNTNLTDGDDVEFNFTPSSGVNALDNCTLWHNISGTWQSNKTDNNLTNGTVNTILLNITKDGTFIWNVNCVNILNGGGFATNGNQSVLLDTRAPSIISPTNKTFTYLLESTSLDFNATDRSPLDTWLVNHTSNFSIDSNGVLTNDTPLLIGIYVLNISINDTLGFVNSTHFKITVIADVVNPTIVINSPTNNTNTSDTGLDILYTATDNVKIDNCWYNNNSNATNVSLGQANITNPVWNEGQHNVTAYCNDTAGNEDSDSITFFVDSIIPYIAILSPTNNSNFTYNTIGVNYTATDTNLGDCLYANGTTGANATLSNCINLSGVTWPEGYNTVRVFALDTPVGNSNHSTVSFTIDTVVPYIAFIDETTSSGTFLQTHIDANVTATDTNGIDTINISLYFNGTGVVNSTTCVSSPCTINFTGLAFGTYFLNSTVNDTFGRTNKTETRTIILSADTSSPNITSITITPGADYIIANCTAVDDIAVTNYSITINGTNESSGIIGSCNYIFTGLTNRTTYLITFNASDDAGNTATNTTTQRTLTGAYSVWTPWGDINLALMFRMINIWKTEWVTPNSSLIECRMQNNGNLDCSEFWDGSSDMNITINGDLNVNGDGNFSGSVTATDLFGDGANITSIGLNADTDVTRVVVVGGSQTINKGQPVYITDATGDKPRVQIGNNQFHNSSHILGISAQTKAPGEEMFVRLLGDVIGTGDDPLDTTMFVEGCRLHLNDNLSCGVQPNGSHIHGGWASKINANTGIIEVTPSDYVHDIQGVVDLNASIGGFGIDFMNFSRVVIGHMDMILNKFTWSGDVLINGDLNVTGTFFNENPADSVANLAAGAVIGGISNVSLVDGDEIQVSEVAGIPGFNVEFNFTSNVAPSRIYFNGRYDGSAAHNIEVLILNFSSGVYVDLRKSTDDIPDDNIPFFREWNVPLPKTDFISGTTVSIRFNHTSSGNSAHDMYFDKVWIT